MANRPVSPTAALCRVDLWTPDAEGTRHFRLFQPKG